MVKSVIYTLVDLLQAASAIEWVLLVAQNEVIWLGQLIDRVIVA
jgi:hypothetical protein